MNIINPYYADSQGRTPFTLPYLKAKESITTQTVNFLFPKNELTNRRALKIIPSFLTHAQGRLNYELKFPFYKASKNPELNGVVQSIFDRLVIQTQKAYPSTKSMSWKIRIKKDSSNNAFCLSGGKIIITTGLIETLKARVNKHISHEDLIASLLSHEMIHAIAEHSSIDMHLALLGAAIQKAVIYLVLSLANPTPLLQLAIRERFLVCLIRIEETINKYCHERVSKWLCQQLEDRCEKNFLIPILMNLSLYLFLYQMIHLLLNMRYSQSQELEADKYGIFLAKSAGFNPRASLSIQEMFMAMEGEENKPKSWFKKLKGLIRTHPYFQTRFQENQKTISVLEKKEKID